MLSLSVDTIQLHGVVSSMHMTAQNVLSAWKKKITAEQIRATLASGAIISELST